MIRRIALSLIWLYQIFISPMLGPHCRYQPTCSTYARVCIHRFGAVRGFWLALRRLLRCHPWGSFGFDPPPVVDISPIPHRSLKRP